MAGRTLTVHLAADTDKFRREMRQASTATSGLKGRIGGLAGSMTTMLGPAMLGVGIAAAGMAVKLGVDGVQAAIADEAAAAKLGQTLQNLGLAHEQTGVEAYIDKMQRATGVADDQLRPAYTRLVTSLGDTQRANDALALALDVSAGTGKSLETVVAALGKAYDGNAGALGRLGTGLDKALLKSGDMDAITKKLSETYAGQAATAADTWAGKVSRVSVAFDELKEAFGQGFLDAIDNADNGMGADGLTGTIQNMEPAMKMLGSTVGETAIAIIDLLSYAQSAKDAFDSWYGTLDGFDKLVVDSVLQTLRAFTGGVITLRDAIKSAVEWWHQLTGSGATNQFGSGQGSMSGGGTFTTTSATTGGNDQGAVRVLARTLTMADNRNSGAVQVLV